MQSSRATSFPLGGGQVRERPEPASRGWECRYAGPCLTLDQAPEPRALVWSPIPEGRSSNSESRGPELRLAVARQTTVSACFPPCTSGSGFAANLPSARRPRGFSRRRSRTLQRALRATGRLRPCQPATVCLEILRQHLPHPSRSTVFAILALDSVAWPRSRCAKFQVLPRYRALLLSAPQSCVGWPNGASCGEHGAIAIEHQECRVLVHEPTERS